MLFGLRGEKYLNRYESPSPLSVTTNKPILFTNLLYFHNIRSFFFIPVFFFNLPWFDGHQNLIEKSLNRFEGYTCTIHGTEKKNARRIREYDQNS